MTDDDLVTTLVPDVDRDLLAVLQQLEELLLMLRATGDPEQDIPDLAAPVADDTALDAVRATIWDALKPTLHPADGQHAGQLLGRADLPRLLRPHDTGVRHDGARRG